MHKVVEARLALNGDGLEVEVHEAIADVAHRLALDNAFEPTPGCIQIVKLTIYEVEEA